MSPTSLSGRFLSTRSDSLTCSRSSLSCWVSKDRLVGIDRLYGIPSAFLWACLWADVSSRRSKKNEIPGGRLALEVFYFHSTSSHWVQAKMCTGQLFRQSFSYPLACIVAHHINLGSVMKTAKLLTGKGGMSFIIPLGGEMVLNQPQTQGNALFQIAVKDKLFEPSLVLCFRLRIEPEF